MLCEDVPPASANDGVAAALNVLAVMRRDGRRLSQLARCFVPVPQALQAFAEAARFIDDPQLASRYREAATRNADFLLTTQFADGRLRRTWRRGHSGAAAFLEDYGALICGLLDLYAVDFDNGWFAAAARLAEQMIADFADPAGGFYDSAAEARDLVVRPKDLQDNATPSGSSLASHALLRLFSYTDNAGYRDRAQVALAQVTPTVRQFPTAFGRWLCVADLLTHPPKQVALSFADDTETVQAMLYVINAGFRPDLALAASIYPPTDSSPALLADRPLKDGRSTAYVCENFVCKQPVTSPEQLAAQLGSTA